MANETVFTGLAHPTDVFSAAISAALLKKAVALPLIYSEDLPIGTNVKYVRKDGSVTSSTGGVSEGANYTTLSQYTTTGVSITVIKDVVSTFVSAEAMQFGGVSEGTLAQKIGEALARELDNEILTKATGFANSVTAANVLTIDDLMDAAYTVRKNIKGAASGKLVALLDHKGAHEISKEIVKSSASVFTIQTMIDLLGRLNIPANGYVGEMAGVAVFQTSGFSTGSSDNKQMVIDPALALAGVYGSSVVMMPPIPTGQGNPSFGWEISGLAWHGVSEWNDTAGCGLNSDS